MKQALSFIVLILGLLLYVFCVEYTFLWYKSLEVGVTLRIVTMLVILITAGAYFIRTHPIVPILIPVSFLIMALVTSQLGLSYLPVYLLTGFAFLLVVFGYRLKIGSVAQP